MVRRRSKRISKKQTESVEGKRTEEAVEDIEEKSTVTEEEEFVEVKEPEKRYEEKPKSDIYTMMILISIILCIVAITLTIYELRANYGVDFGGLF